MYRKRFFYILVSLALLVVWGLTIGLAWATSAVTTAATFSTAMNYSESIAPNALESSQSAPSIQPESDMGTNELWQEKVDMRRMSRAVQSAPDTVMPAVVTDSASDTNELWQEKVDMRRMQKTVQTTDAPIGTVDTAPISPAVERYRLLKEKQIEALDANP